MELNRSLFTYDWGPRSEFKCYDCKLPLKYDSVQSYECNRTLTKWTHGSCADAKRNFIFEKEWLEKNMKDNNYNTEELLESLRKNLQELQVENEKLRNAKLEIPKTYKEKIYQLEHKLLDYLLALEDHRKETDYSNSQMYTLSALKDLKHLRSNE